jgi:hypothetical protein
MASRLRQPRVFAVLRRTVAKVDSIGFVVLRCGQCSAGKVESPTHVHMAVDRFGRGHPSSPNPTVHNPEPQLRQCASWWWGYSNPYQCGLSHYHQRCTPLQRSPDSRRGFLLNVMPCLRLELALTFASSQAKILSDLFHMPLKPLYSNGFRTLLRHHNKIKGFRHISRNLIWIQKTKCKRIVSTSRTVIRPRQ